MDAEQVRTHLSRLYDDGHRFELVAIKGGQARRAEFTWPQDLEAVLSAVSKFEEHGFNLFASVLPMQLQEEGKYDRLWFDRDNPLGPWPFGADPGWVHPAWPDPSVIVRTSEGEQGGARFQAVWRLDSPVTEEEGRRLIRQLAERGDGDKVIHDPRRIFRLAGVTNAKRGGVARLLASSPGTVNVEQFMLPQLVEDGMPTLEALQTMTVSSPNAVLGEWLDGASEGDRARKAYVTARFLKGCGVTYDDAIPILVLGARRATPPLSDDEVLHAVRSAYHKD